jgi:hypothetical protein
MDYAELTRNLESNNIVRDSLEHKKMTLNLLNNYQM